MNASLGRRIILLRISGGNLLSVDAEFENIYGGRVGFSDLVRAKFTGNMGYEGGVESRYARSLFRKHHWSPQNPLTPDHFNTHCLSLFQLRSFRHLKPVIPPNGLQDQILVFTSSIRPINRWLLPPHSPCAKLPKAFSATC